MTHFSLRPIITAFIFLTRIPMPTLEDFQPEDSGQALAFFPIVGLAIGLCMAIAAVFQPLPSSLMAALLLLFWVFITGGLHIDGLGDSADGWLGGTGNKQRSLEIMQDPCSGSAAVMAICCLLIVKFAALSALLEQSTFSAIIFAPIIGRCIPLILFLTTPYVRKDGLAQNFIQHASKPAIYCMLIAVFALALIFLGLQSAVITFITAAIILLGLRYLMIKRLGGNTGDTTGAAIEIIEATILILLVIV